MSDKLRFTPVKGTEEKILASPKQDGYVYFATDTHKIYLDTATQAKILMGAGGSGGSNSGIFYGSRKALETDSEDGLSIVFSINDIEGDVFPSADDLILNAPDGSFYRVVSISTSKGTITANRLTVAGNGSGGNSSITKGVMTVVNHNTETSILNGSEYDFSITITSPADKTEGVLYSEKDALYVTISYYKGIGNDMSADPYFTETKRLTSGVVYEYSAGSNLRDSQDTTITFVPGIIGYNGALLDMFTHSSAQITKAVTCTSLTLEWLETSFNNNTYFTDKIGVQANGSSVGERIYDVYFDDELIHTQSLANGEKISPLSISRNSLVYDAKTMISTGESLGEKYSHGAHMIKAQLSLKNSSGARGSSTDLIKKEIALRLDNSKPLIWVGDINDVYYEYDTIFLPFRAFDPNSTDGIAKVYEYKNGASVLGDGGYERVSNTAVAWTYWEISNLSVAETASYTLSVGSGDNKEVRTFTFNIQKDPRNMKIESDAALSFYAKGRSNTQSNKETLLLNGKKAILEGFNWYNNGWITSDNKTSLKISNGASAKLPIGLMTFGAADNNSHTIEFKMKVSNIQDYSTLVINYTRYKYEDDKVSWNDDIKSEQNPNGSGIFQKFLDQRATGFTNYDAYLTKQLPIEQKNAAKDVFWPSYDDLQFDKLYKDYNLNNAIITYKADDADVSSDPSICFGPQDGFFSNGTDSVTVNFVEDEIINVAIVCNGGTTMTGDDNLMKIYINGMLTSLARSTKSKNGTNNATWNIGNQGGETYLEINSNICDIDLYSLRIYNKALNVAQILHNYAFDNTDTLQWDLVEELYEIRNNQYQFSFNKMLTYNNSDDVKNGKKQAIMPYIVFTTNDEDEFGKGNLPWFKTESDDTGVSHYESVDMEFVNPALDIANRRGLLVDEAKEAGYVDTIKYKREKDDAVFNAYQTYYDKQGNVQEVTADKYVPGKFYLKSGLTAVQDYYLHHCPSWTSKGTQLGVQGTSSEFYPRRNYKAKTKADMFIYKKDANGNDTTIKEAQECYLGGDESSPIHYTEYLTESEYEMIPHLGPFETEYNNYQKAEGKLDPRRLKYFYYDNDAFGTNKFTLKIDFMESSGSYNMGLANLVYNAYSHHPLDDYNTAKAVVEIDPIKSFYFVASGEYDPEKKYYYVTQKGDVKPADGTSESVMKITSADDFNCTPATLWQTKSTDAIKVLMTSTKLAASPELGLTEGNFQDFGGNSSDWKTVLFPSIDSIDDTYVNVWLEAIIEYKESFVNNVNSLRTSVQGFPTLAFHQTKTMRKNGEEPIFIGRYNMLLDKGADEAYGFKLDNLLGYAGNNNISKVAECWEFENNNRGFCSFRDPWNRKELSFDAPESVKQKNASSAFTSNLSPIVADSFEYRYHNEKDFIDLLVHLKASAGSNEARVKLYSQYGFDVGDTTSGLDNGRKQLLKIYQNWEKAVAWVWSTATDAVIDIKGDGNAVEVPSLGTYVKNLKVGIPFIENTYYTRSFTDDGDEKFTIAATYTESVYNAATGENEPVTYYQLQTVDGSSVYSAIKLVAPDDTENVYEPNKFYINVGTNTYMLSDSATMEQDETYYSLTIDTSKLVDWKLPTDEEGNVIHASWDVDGRYDYDTKEYRLAKFKNELTSHFNFEYLITYFVITEVLECYDSRGKNCMMASWGPQRAGGDYIWYPIFYDLDTQLGINNTGIPSFEYDIDATEQGTFSTNDSVLWNNLYTIFKDSISLKYQQLKGTAITDFIGPQTSVAGRLNNPPFTSVEQIEQFYSCDPKLYKSYSMKGERPLLALNMDEYYKYIAITNTDTAKNSHKTSGQNELAVPPLTEGFVGSNIGLPLWECDTSNTYFYALQGNRSMSRRQFLTNRINYIDSWLNVGNYARAGKNRIRSRVSANSSSSTSDKWIEGTATNGDSGLITGSAYYLEDGKTKAHLFDGEYWITMTPARNMYVTVGTDAANFPSLKYSGTPVRFETADLENGVRKSGNYREQLYYIYGLDQMKSLGDLSRLYFQEFALEGKISKLTDLKLGYDGLETIYNEDGSVKEVLSYANKNVNDWTIPGSSEGTGMPLLKEVNLCNITFKNPAKVVDLTSCTKLQNFRCTGSNIVGVNFAEGVALDTLYLSDTITSLTLTEAKMLTELITDYQAPVADEDGNLVAQKGLYIARLTDGKDGYNTAITSLNIAGGNLGYNSYRLLKKFFELTKGFTTKRSINLTNVQWSPYVSVNGDAERDDSITYYVDNGHFGLREFKSNSDDWIALRANGRLYTYDSTMDIVDIKDTNMLEYLINNSLFTGINDIAQPNITGIIYINNDDIRDEGEIQTKLQLKYPNLTFFFNKVDTGYAAKYVIATVNEDGTVKERVIGTEKLGKEAFAEKQFFPNPLDRAGYDAYNSQQIDQIIVNKDFLGWATINDKSGLVETYDKNWLNYATGNTVKHDWNTLSLTEDIYDYTFYAVFDYHYYSNFFHDGDGNVYERLIKYGDTVTAPPVTEFNPVKSDAGLEDTHTYSFMGWAMKEGGTTKTDLSKYLSTENRHFYAFFEEIDVHDNMYYVEHIDEYFDFENYGYVDTLDEDTYNIPSMQGYSMRVKAGVDLSGKVTLPTYYKNLPVTILTINSDRTGFGNVTHVFWDNKHGTPKVRKINDNLFSGAKKLQYFEFIEGIREIGDSAFKSTLQLTSVSFNSDLRVIGNDAFSNGNLSSISIPSSVRRIGTQAFRYLASKDTLLTIGTPTEPSRVSFIGRAAFAKNSAYEYSSITIYCYESEDNSPETLDDGLPKYYGYNWWNSTDRAGSTTHFGVRSIADDIHYPNLEK